MRYAERKSNNNSHLFFGSKGFSILFIVFSTTSTQDINPARKTIISKFPSQFRMFGRTFLIWNYIDWVCERREHRENNLILKLFNIMYIQLQCRGIMFGNKVRYTIAVGFFFISLWSSYIHSMKPFRKGFSIILGLNFLCPNFYELFFIFHVV